MTTRTTTAADAIRAVLVALDEEGDAARAVFYAQQALEILTAEDDPTPPHGTPRPMTTDEHRRYVSAVIGGAPPATAARTARRTSSPAYSLSRRTFAEAMAATTWQNLLTLAAQYVEALAEDDKAGNLDLLHDTAADLAAVVAEIQTRTRR